MQLVVYFCRLVSSIVMANHLRPSPPIGLQDSTDEDGENEPLLRESNSHIDSCFEELSVRAEFIRKAHFVIVAQLLIIAGIVATFTYTPSIKQFYR